MAHPVPVLFASTRFYRSNHMYLLLWIGIVHEASAHCAYYSNEVGQLCMVSVVDQISQSLQQLTTKHDLRLRRVFRAQNRTLCPKSRLGCPSVCEICAQPPEQFGVGCLCLGLGFECVATPCCHGYMNMQPDLKLAAQRA